MRALPDFELHNPRSLAEAVALLAQGEARALGGGTDLLPNLRRGIGQPSRLVDLREVEGFDAVEGLADGRLRLGAGVTLAALESDATVRAHFPVLAQAATCVAARGHRTAATLGGNLCQDTRCIFYNQSEWWRASNGYCLKRGGTRCHVAPQGERCHAAFCSDLAPVLLVLDAQVDLVSATGARSLPLARLYRDDGAAHLALEDGELVASVTLPAPPAGRRVAFDKARVRGGIDFPLAAVAIGVSVEAGRIADLRVAVSGTNSMPLLLAGTSVLHGAALDDQAAQQLGKLMARQVTPMRSTVTPANYRREAAVALSQRLLRELAA